MLLQNKMYLIGFVYFLGAVFMIIFPPRNFKQSGAKTRVMRSVNELKFSSYLDYEQLSNEAEKMSKEDSEVITLHKFSQETYGKRHLIALELRSDRHTKKPGILIVGGLSGMSWGATNAIIELAQNLAYNTNYQTPFFNDYDWYLIPIGNPDGLYFTQSIRHRNPIATSVWVKNETIRQGTRPMEWIKNVEAKTSTDRCFGTNIDRNFAYHWRDDVPKKPDPCSYYYPGEKPYSSAEAKSIRAYVDKLGDTIQLAIHLDASYKIKKEFILYPWGYTMRHPSNYRTLQAIGEYAARHARMPDGRLYQVHQRSSDGRVAGTLSDYIAGVVGTDLVYLIKPYHHPFPDVQNLTTLEPYVKQAVTAVLGLVRGWRSSTKLNTLSFFGRDIEF